VRRPDRLRAILDNPYFETVPKFAQPLHIQAMAVEMNWNHVPDRSIGPHSRFREIQVQQPESVTIAEDWNGADLDYR
jgi:hypothetical protein